MSNSTRDFLDDLQVQYETSVMLATWTAVFLAGIGPLVSYVTLTIASKTTPSFANFGFPALLAAIVIAFCVKPCSKWLYRQKTIHTRSVLIDKKLLKELMALDNEEFAKLYFFTVRNIMKRDMAYYKELCKGELKDKLRFILLFYGDVCRKSRHLPSPFLLHIAARALGLLVLLTCPLRLYQFV